MKHFNEKARISKSTYMSNSVLFLISILFYIKHGGYFFSFIPMPVYFSLALVLTIVSNKIIKLRLGFLMMILFFLLNMTLSLSWTNAINYGGQKVATLIFTIIFFYIIYPVIYRNFKRFLEINILFFLLFILTLIDQYGFLTDLGDVINVSFRLGWDDEDSALNPIGISRYIYYGIINCIIYYLYYNKSLKTTTVLIVTSLVGVLYSLLTGTKAPILAFLLSLTIYYLFNKFNSKKIKIRFVVLTAFIISTLFLGDVLSHIGVSSEQSEFFQARFLDTESAIDDRSFQNSRALEKINGINILFGEGVGDFGHLYTSKDERDYPHNLLTEVFYENGILNVIILILILFYSIKKIRNNNSKRLSFFIIGFSYNGYL